MREVCTPTLQLLYEAQRQAQSLFAAIEAQSILQPGQSESAISRKILDLARRQFAVEKFWHKRVIRVGANTVRPYQDNPDDRVLQEDDIAFVDLGPLFVRAEADFGRTYVLGNDPRKQQLAADLPRIFTAAKNFYHGRPSMTGAELYAHVVDLCRQRGYAHGNYHAGHLLGMFPHEKQQGEGRENYICAANEVPMTQAGRDGEPRYWVLEVHAIHESGSFGGFYEELLS